MKTFTSIGQQNFFNVPSSEITEKRHLFFQQQFNITLDGITGNSTFDYGLGKNWEIGFNVLDVAVDKYQKVIYQSATTPYVPLLMLNTQKKIILNHHSGIAIGTQVGMSLTPDIKTCGYAYTNYAFHSDKLGLKGVLGLYSSTDGYAGKDSRFIIPQSNFFKPIGVQAGIEKMIWKNKCMLQIDYISGGHSIGVSVFGLAYKFIPHWILSAGYQIPNPKAEASQAVIVEFTYN